MALILIGIEGFFRMSWLACLVGRTCLGELGCDFNVIWFPSERLGVAHFCPAMMVFSNFIFYQGLVDLSLVGGSYIWLNNQESHSWAKIDRFLVSLA
jgi:hypothetical protein